MSANNFMHLNEKMSSCVCFIIIPFGVAKFLKKIKNTLEEEPFLFHIIFAVIIFLNFLKSVKKIDSKVFVMF